MTPASVKDAKVDGKMPFLKFIKNLVQIQAGSNIPWDYFGFVHYKIDLTKFMSKNKTESETENDLGLDQ